MPTSYSTSEKSYRRSYDAGDDRSSYRSSRESDRASSRRSYDSSRRSYDPERRPDPPGQGYIKTVDIQKTSDPQQSRARQVLNPLLALTLIPFLPMDATNGKDRELRERRPDERRVLPVVDKEDVRPRRSVEDYGSSGGSGRERTHVHRHTSKHKHRSSQ